MIRAIVFDFYDTLVYRDVAETSRTREAIAAMFGVTAADLNLLWRRDRDARMLGEIATLEEHLRAMLAELGAFVPEDTLAEAASLEREGQRRAVHPYANTERVLGKLRQMGFALGLLSNSSDTAQIPLGSLGLGRYFDAIVLSHEVGILKPNPRIYEVTCIRLGVQPHECAFVADGGFGELDAAHDVGMLAVKIEQDAQSPDYGSSTYFDLCLHDVEDLLAVAEEWRSSGALGGSR